MKGNEEETGPGKKNFVKPLSIFALQQPRKWTTILGTQVNPYDATKSGPLCPQLGLDPEIFEHYLVSFIL